VKFDKHAFVLPALAVVVALALAACGGGGSSDKVTPSAYVTSVCKAVGPFEKDVVNRTSALNLSTISSPAQGRTALQGFLSSISTDTKKALAQLKAAGTPDVKNGKAIANAIVNAFGQLDTTMTQAVKQSQSLPTNSATAFKAAAQKLGATVRNSMSSIGTNLQSGTLKSPALEQAAAKAPACKALSA
jgi:hypothetical protein